MCTYVLVGVLSGLMGVVSGLVGVAAGLVLSLCTKVLDVGLVLPLGICTTADLEGVVVVLVRGLAKPHRRALSSRVVVCGVLGVVCGVVTVVCGVSGLVGTAEPVPGA